MVLINLKGPFAEFKRAKDYIYVPVLFQITPLAFRRCKFIRYYQNRYALLAVGTGRLKERYAKFSPSFRK